MNSFFYLPLEGTGKEVGVLLTIGYTSWDFYEVGSTTVTIPNVERVTVPVVTTTVVTTTVNVSLKTVTVRGHHDDCGSRGYDGYGV